MSKLNHAQEGRAPLPTDRPALNGAAIASHTVKRVGIVGANQTGMGIAMQLLDADIPVTVFELDRTSLDRGIALARSGYQAAVLQRRLDCASRDRRMALLSGSINFHHLKDCDLVIEAVSTDIEAKGALFRRLDETVRPGAILMTCSSPSRVDQLAASTRRAGEVLGLHLSCPAQVGETWTLIPGKGNSGQSLATMVALVQHLRKTCVVSGGWAGVGARDSSPQRDSDGADAVSWHVDQAQE